MRERFVSSIIALPLTLTLSPGEREQRAAASFYLGEYAANSVAHNSGVPDFEQIATVIDRRYR